MITLQVTDDTPFADIVIWINGGTPTIIMSRVKAYVYLLFNRSLHGRQRHPSGELTS